MLIVGGSLKKLNNANSKGFLLGIIFSILSFFLTVNLTYAYFTATTAKNGVGSATTALMKVVFSQTSKTINSTVITGSDKLLPNDTFAVTAKLQNTGNVSVYAIVSLVLNITKADSSVETIRKYFTLEGSTLKEITGAPNNYTNHAFELNANASSSTFTASYKFLGTTYDNSYQNARVEYTLKANAIQTANIESNITATNLLMKNAGYPGAQI